MGWARLDDGFHDHPKVDSCSLPAIGLYTLCLTWAHRHRKTAPVPGHVSEARVAKVAGRNGAKYAAELVAAGLWETCDVPDGWVIHDFLDYLPKERDPRERAAAGRRGAQSRWETHGNLPSASHEEDGKAIAEGMASDGSRASAPAFPTRPVPKDPSSETAPPRPDVDRLCTLLADLVEANGSKRPTITKRWTDACRLMLDTDGRTEAQAEKAIRWCQADEFWRANVLSMPTLRDKFDQLRLAAQRGPSTQERQAQVAASGYGWRG